MTEICAICQEDLSDNIYELPECGHKYHTNCIMHWFRTNHNTCPLCQNQGINYTHALQEANNGHYFGRRVWMNYYKGAATYARKKDSDKEIISKVKGVQKSIKKRKELISSFKEWKKENCDINKTNDDIYKEYIKIQKNKRKAYYNIWRKKVAVGYLYYHKILQNKIIIAEKVQIN